MKLLKYIGLVWLILGLTACSLRTDPVPSSNNTNVPPKRVLFVGNSYFYYNDSLHNYVRHLVRKSDPGLKGKLQFKSATINGAHLHHHDIDHLTKAGAIGVKEPFEWVVLQEFSGAALSEGGQKLFRQTVRRFDQVIKARGGRTALYMTPAYVAPNRKAAPENIDLIRDLYVSAGLSTGAKVIPVGLAFEEAYKRRPGIQLHKSFDGSHPDLMGTYLAACTVYASLYERSPVGNAYKVWGQIDDEIAGFLQQVAWDTVRQFTSTDKTPEKQQ